MESQLLPNASSASLKLPPAETFTISTPQCGKFTVIVEGIRSKGETVVLTLHDVGTNTREVRDFLAQSCMKAIARRVVWVHVTVPGQEDGAQELEAPSSNGPAFPSLQQLADDLPFVLDHLKVNSVVLFGEGAGANVLLRFALNSKDRVLGAILLNCTASSAGFIETQREKVVSRRLSRAQSVSHSSESHLAYLHFGAKSGDGSPQFEAVWEHFCEYLRTSINPRNLHYYLSAFFERNNLLSHMSKLSVPLLLIAGARSDFSHTMHSLNATLLRTFKNEPQKRRQIEYLRVDGVVSPMHEKPDKLAECIQYFLQGLGVLGSLSPILASSTSFSDKDSIVEFRSHLNKDAVSEQAEQAGGEKAKGSKQKAAEPEMLAIPARGRRMSMQEFDVPRGPDSFRAYGAQMIRGVRSPSVVD